MADKPILLLSTPEAAQHAARLFRDMEVRSANGRLPEGEWHDTLAASTDLDWLAETCRQLAEAKCGRIRQWPVDLLQCDSFDAVKTLTGSIKPYQSSAPSTTPATVTPVPTQEPKVAEPSERAQSDDLPEQPYEDDDEDSAAEMALHSIRMASNVVHLRAVEDRPTDDWPEPVNFWTKSPLPAFDPLWIIPAVRPFVLNQAAMVGCDPGITWLQTVAFAAGCLSDDIRVRVRPLQDWSEAARLWVCIVGDSGDGKSPSMNGIMAPSRELKMQIAERSKLAQAGYKDELDLHELERREWLSRRQKMQADKPAGPRPVAPPKPVNEMLYFNSTTSEGLLEQQEATTRGTMCYADEFLGWLMGMDQYKAGGRGSDRQFWLSSWDGAEFVGVLVGKLRTIPNTGVTIIGGSQPGAIRRAVSKLDLDSDGLLQRVLIYNSQGEATEDAEQPADRDAVTRWRNILNKLYAMKTHLDHCVFSAQSHAIRREANEWIKQMRGIDAIPMAAKQALSKWRAYLPRIALTLHAIEAADNGYEVIPATIEEHTTATAWEYMRGCLWPHLLHFYGTITEDNEQRVHLLAFANFVLARKLTEVRPAYLPAKWSHYKRKMQTIEQRRQFWAAVTNAGWARATDKFDRTGQISACYIINPSVFNLFADQAEIAAEQAEHFRDAMLPSFRREPGQD